MKPITINVHVHLPEWCLQTVAHSLAQIHTKLDKQGVLLMSINDDLKAARAELAEANVTTTEIAEDVADLVQRAIDAPANSAEATALLAEASALKAKLRAVADTHTPGSQPPPPVV